MKLIFHFLFVVISALTPQTFAGGGGGDGGDGGYDHENGGDMCEYRFKSVRDDLSAWIAKGGAASLRLPAEISLQKYVQSMLEKIQIANVRCTDEQVVVSGAEKTCKNFVTGDGKSQIVCNRNLFMTTKDSDQYVLVHHEYAGLAEFEVNIGESSNYEISKQIIEYLETKVSKKLVVKPSPGFFIDPFNPASCEGPEMSLQDAAKIIGQPTWESVVFAAFALHTRERQCDKKNGCGEWEIIHNQMPHPDMTGTRRNMLVPGVGTVTLSILSDNTSFNMSFTSSDRGLAGQGVDISCTSVKGINTGCSMMALPTFKGLGDVSANITPHCARLEYKHKGFYADNEYFVERRTSLHEPIRARGPLWIERESVFVSRY